MNDNAPSFTRTEYVASLPESTALGANVLQVSAVDKDENPVLRYSMDPLTPDPARNTFYINQSSGMVTLISSLDYETIQQYKFGVLVTDALYNPHTSSATVIVYVLGTSRRFNSSFWPIILSAACMNFWNCKKILFLVLYEISICFSFLL